MSLIMPFRRRTRAPACGLAASLTVLAALAAWPSPAGAVDPAAEAQVRAAGALFAKFEKADVEKLSKALDALVADPAFVEPFRARDREKLLAAARPRFEKLKAEQQITHWYFLEPEPARTCFLRVHNPALHGDVVKRFTLAQAIATQRLGAGKELGKTAFALRVVKPIRAGGKVIGYMELGEEIDHFLERMKQDTGDDYGIVADKKHIDRAELARVRSRDQWDDRQNVVTITSTMWDERKIHLTAPVETLPAKGVIVGEWTEGDKRFVAAAFPVLDAREHAVAALLVRHRVKTR